MHITLTTNTLTQNTLLDVKHWTQNILTQNTDAKYSKFFDAKHLTQNVLTQNTMFDVTFDAKLFDAKH